METPNKIYIQQDMINNIPLEQKEFDDDVEYIRKEAILEWLEERINDGDEEGLMTNQIANFAYKDVIDKLNSL